MCIYKYKYILSMRVYTCMCMWFLSVCMCVSLHICICSLRKHGVCSYFCINTYSYHKVISMIARK